MFCSCVPPFVLGWVPNTPFGLLTWGKPSLGDGNPHHVISYTSVHERGNNMDVCEDVFREYACIHSCMNHNYTYIFAYVLFLDSLSKFQLFCIFSMEQFMPLSWCVRCRRGATSTLGCTHRHAHRSIRARGFRSMSDEPGSRDK